MRLKPPQWSAGTLKRNPEVAYYGYNRFGIVYPGNSTNEFGLQGHYDSEIGNPDDHGVRGRGAKQ